ncbi:hypothetical protein HEP84_00250 [Streptomyces sp. RLB1-33]|nr:hypothetical protein [Streptomyces sp. RLB1-33]QIY67998.1 hypothetical protein HEP84_00250 [Streptomyces sp. RLB1-33]
MSLRTNWRSTLLARTALVGVILGVGLTSCTEQHATSRPTGPVSAPSASAIDLATHSGTWPRTQRGIEDALSALERHCLRDNGFDYPVVRSAPFTNPENETAVINLAERRTHGYGFDTAPTAPPSDAFYNQLTAKEKRRFTAVLFGPDDKRRTVGRFRMGTVTVPAQGCIAQSRRQLFDDVVTWAQITYTAEDIDERLAHAATSDPQYTAALRLWSACMKSRGYIFASPAKAEAAAKAAHGPTGPPGKTLAKEIHIAVADGTCAQASHLTRSELQVRRRLVTTLPPNDRRLLEHLAKRRYMALKRAHSLGLTGETMSPP